MSRDAERSKQVSSLATAVFGLVAMLAFPCGSFGQTLKSPGSLTGESFDAASVRRNTSKAPNSSVRGFPGGRFVATNATVLDLIRFAFATRPYDIVVDDRVPSMLRDARFDVVATAGRDVPLPTRSIGPMNRMVQALLVERFRLVTSVEKRDHEAYVLSLARNDGRLGPQLRRSAIDCAARSTDPNRPAPRNTEEAMFCAIVSADTLLRARGHTMSQFAEHIARRFQKPVIDETGLVGPFEFELTASWDGLVPSNGIPPPPRFASQPVPIERPSAPSLFSALPEQLGLRLQFQKRSLAVLVIERIGAPTEN